MTENEMREHGWHKWYHDDYWVHPDLVADPAQQDYTMYGRSFKQAVLAELAGRKPEGRRLPIELFND